MSNKLIYGVALNDVGCFAQEAVNGSRVHCKFYATWKGVLERCYSKKCQDKHPTYIGCSLSNEWLVFSNFKRWMETQDWQGKEIDKDLLFVGNKIYSPYTCVFVDRLTNSFVIDCGASRGAYPLGVGWHIRVEKFQARCSNPFSKKREHLGYFSCQHEAHIAWKKRKRELACKLADLQSDKRVAEALRTRYL